VWGEGEGAGHFSYRIAPRKGKKGKKAKKMCPHESVQAGLGLFVSFGLGVIVVINLLYRGLCTLGLESIHLYERENKL